MTRSLSISLMAIAFAAIWIGQAQALPAATLTTAEADPPTELAEPIRAALDSKVVRLSENNKPFFEFWFRKELTLPAAPNGDFAMSGIPEGTVIGAVRVNEERFDFKDEEIPPGVYVMRFCLQPEDGNHLGVSPTRTFVLLIPAAEDQSLEGIEGHDPVVEASSTVNAAAHPSNLNLQPAKESSGKFPRLAEHSDGDHKVLYVRLPVKVEGGQSVDLDFALVYQGMGQV